MTSGPMITIETVIPPYDGKEPSAMSADYQDKMVSVSPKDIGTITTGIATMLESLKEARSVVQVVKVVPKWVRRNAQDIPGVRNDLRLMFSAHAVLTGIGEEKVKTDSVQCSLEGEAAGEIFATSILGKIIAEIARQATQAQDLSRHYQHLFRRAT